MEAARAVLKNFNPVQQRELVVEALYKAFPKPILSMVNVLDRKKETIFISILNSLLKISCIFLLGETRTDQNDVT